MLFENGIRYRTYDAHGEYLDFQTLPEAKDQAKKWLDEERNNVGADGDWCIGIDEICIIKCEIIYEVKQTKGLGETGNSYNTDYDYTCDYQLKLVTRRGEQK